MSGGTTTVINATLVGVIKSVKASKSIDRLYAGVPGLLGVFDDSLIDLTDLSVSQLERLRYTPSSGFIGATRLKYLDDYDFKRLETIFDKYQIKYFLNIGGNGTIKQTMSISAYFKGSVKVASLPKTVDNDLGDKEFEKVFFTPGYPSCINYWIHKVNMLNQENLGAHSHDRVLIGQTFGRKTGFITAAARMADIDRNLPLILLLPENQRPIAEVLAEIDRKVTSNKRAVVIMSEGYHIDDVGEIRDYSGQVMYGSSKSTAVQLLVNACLEKGIQSRGFNPTVDQRSEMIFTLEHDLTYAESLGKLAVDNLEQGNSEFLASIGSTADYEILETIIPYSEIKDFSRIMPDHWLEPNSFDVSDGYIAYARKVLADFTRINLGQQYFHKFLLSDEILIK